MDEQDGKLIPYVFNGVSWSIPDEVMLGIYQMLEDARIIPKLFYGMDMNPQNFFALMRDRVNVVHVIMLDRVKPAFIAWLNSWGHNYAFGHYSGFPWTWGQTQHYVKQTLDYWFGVKRYDGEPLIDVILGLTPMNNRLAIRTALRSGFRKLAEIKEIQFGADPSTKVGGVWTAITREEHYGRRG